MRGDIIARHLLSYEREDRKDKIIRTIEEHRRNSIKRLARELGCTNSMGGVKKNRLIEKLAKEFNCTTSMGGVKKDKLVKKLAKELNCTDSMGRVKWNKLRRYIDIDDF